MIVWIPCSGYAFSSIHIQRTNQWGGLAGSAPEYAERSIVVQNENLGVGGGGRKQGRSEICFTDKALWTNFIQFIKFGALFLIKVCMRLKS